MVHRKRVASFCNSPARWTSPEATYEPPAPHACGPDPVPPVMRTPAVPISRRGRHVGHHPCFGKGGLLVDARNHTGPGRGGGLRRRGVPGVPPDRGTGAFPHTWLLMRGGRGVVPTCLVTACTARVWPCLRRQRGRAAPRCGRSRRSCRGTGCISWRRSSKTRSWTRGTRCVRRPVCPVAPGTGVSVCQGYPGCAWVQRGLNRAAPYALAATRTTLAAQELPEAVKVAQEQVALDIKEWEESTQQESLAV